MSTIDPNKLKTLDTYNNGKFQRLNLLFAVNGGVLLLAQFMSGMILTWHLERGYVPKPQSKALDHLAVKVPGTEQDMMS